MTYVYFNEYVNILLKRVTAKYLFKYKLCHINIEIEFEHKMNIKRTLRNLSNKNSFVKKKNGKTKREFLF